MLDMRAAVFLVLATAAFTPVSEASQLRRGTADSERHVNISTRSGVHATSMSASNTSTPPATRPRLFFLFLTQSGIGHPELWNTFFHGMDVGYYRVLMHCKTNAQCLQKPWTAPPGTTMVDAVPTSYCVDLVSAMVQLLKQAVAESTSAADKFIFLSESTLPLKPFPEIYHTLTTDDNSDICVNRAESWNQMRFGGLGRKVLVVKHNQWVVLNKEHAGLMVKRWPSVHEVDASGHHWSVAVRSQSGQLAEHQNPLPAMENNQCSDEWAIFATLFGVLSDDGWQHMVSLPKFGGGGSLQMRAGGLGDTWQGNCRTFVFWNQMPGDPMTELAQSLQADFPNSQLSCWPHCGDTHPAEIAALSDHGAALLRRSGYLFGRKFPDHVMTLDQFQRIILAPAGAIPAV